MRDILIHNDMGADLSVAWDVSQQAIPHLKAKIEAILQEENRAAP